MMSKMLPKLLLISLALFTASCISVSLKPPTTSSLKNLDYQPPKNFSPIKDLELSYQDPASGQIIFVESICPSDQEQFAIDLSQSLKSPQLIQKSLVSINQQTVQTWHYKGKKQNLMFNLFINHWELNNCSIYITLMSQDETVTSQPTDFTNSLQTLRVAPK